MPVLFWEVKSFALAIRLYELRRDSAVLIMTDLFGHERSTSLAPVNGVRAVLRL